MKIHFAVIAAFLTLNLAHAGQLSCVSDKKIDGWDGAQTRDFLKVEAEVSKGKLKNPSINGAFAADHAGSLAGKISKNKKWIRYSGIEDAWCWFTVVLPADFKAKTKSFAGFVDKNCEEGSGQESFRVSCTLE